MNATLCTRKAPATLNPHFTFTNSVDVPDQVMSERLRLSDIEKQRDVVRRAYAQYSRDEDKPDYDKAFEQLQFMTRWHSHLSEINERGRDPRQASNFVRYRVPFQHIDFSIAH